MEIVAFAVLALSLAAVGISWNQARAGRILERWARENCYRILSSRRCWFWQGPFFLRSSDDQAVFKITVADGPGQVRRGWVRCGSFWAGLLSNRAEVRWGK